MSQADFKQNPALPPSGVSLAHSQDVWRWLAGAAVIIVFVAIVYSPAFQAGYVWDDRELLIANPQVTEPGGLAEIWTSFSGPDYLPLTLSAAWGQYRLWGDSPVGFHTFNIALHALGCLLLWLVLKRLAIPGAWLAALLFAIHPVNVASVAWVAELKNVLSFALASSATLCYLRSEESKAKASYISAIVLFVAALLAKASVVCLPPMLLLFVWWRRGRVTRVDLRRIAPFFLIALSLGLVTVWFQSQHVIGDKVVRPEGWASRLTAVGWCLWFYVGKGLVPTKLSMIYPRFEVDAGNPLHHVPNLLWLAVVGACLWFCRRRKAANNEGTSAGSYAQSAQEQETSEASAPEQVHVPLRHHWSRGVLVLIVFWALALAPVLGFVDMYFFLFSLVSDHLQHIALAGTCAAIALLFWQALEQRSKVWRLLAAGVLLCVIGGFSYGSWQRCGQFATLETLWQDTLAKNSRAWVAHNGLGIISAQDGDTAAAIAHYRAAIVIRPDYPEALNNLGVLLSRQGEGDEAITHLERAVESDPAYAEAWSNLGNALAREVRYEEACNAYQKAIAAKPDYIKAHYNLGLALGKRWMWTEAAASFAETIRLDTGHSRARYRLGEALLRGRQYAEAVKVLTEVSRLQDVGAAASPLLREAKVQLSREKINADRYK